MILLFFVPVEKKTTRFVATHLIEPREEGVFPHHTCQHFHTLGFWEVLPRHLIVFGLPRKVSEQDLERLVQEDDSSERELLTLTVSSVSMVQVQVILGLKRVRHDPELENVPSLPMLFELGMWLAKRRRSYHANWVQLTCYPRLTRQPRLMTLVNQTFGLPSIHLWSMPMILRHLVT